MLNSDVGTCVEFSFHLEALKVSGQNAACKAAAGEHVGFRLSKEESYVQREHHCIQWEGLMNLNRCGWKTEKPCEPCYHRKPELINKNCVLTCNHHHLVLLLSNEPFISTSMDPTMFLQEPRAVKPHMLSRRFSWSDAFTTSGKSQEHLGERWCLHSYSMQTAGHDLWTLLQKSGVFVCSTSTLRCLYSFSLTC